MLGGRFGRGVLGMSLSTVCSGLNRHTQIIPTGLEYLPWTTIAEQTCRRVILIGEKEGPHENVARSIIAC